MSQYETPQRGSRRLDLLKARLLQTLETAWRHHPARTAYEVYTDPVNDAGDTIGADNAEIIHDFTAQALASITSNVLVRLHVMFRRMTGFQLPLSDTIAPLCRAHMLNLTTLPPNSRPSSKLSQRSINCSRD